MIDIYATELIVTYKLGDDLLELKKSSDENSGFTFGILDKEQNKFTSSTEIEFESTNELKEIISDFETKYNLLIKIS